MRNAGVHSSVLSLFGETPMVALDRITHDIPGRIVAKLDLSLPGGSKKDRAALAVLESLRASGDLREGQTAVCLTSGNVGTGLAIAAAQLGHPFIAVMSVGNTPERAQMMRAFGAEIELVDQVDGAPGQVTGQDLDAVELRADQIARERDAVNIDQFEHSASIEAHREGTGREIWEQTGGKVEAFVDFVGSGGTLAGVSAALKARNAGICCYAVEPREAVVLARSGQAVNSHGIQGGGYARAKLPHLSDVTVDGYLTVSTAESAEMSRRLAREEGLFAGYSAGANVAAALHLLQGHHAGETVACILCDSGMKYLSGDLWA